MMNGWQVKKLGDICEFENGLWAGKKPPFQKVGVIRNTNFTKDGRLNDSDIVCLEVEQSRFMKRKLQYGDIILEKSGGGPNQPVGRVIIFDKKEGDYSFSNFTSVIRIANAKAVDFTYLHKFLFFSYVSGATEKMQSHSTGIRNLKFDDYKAIEIPLPPLAEQQSIVTILDQTFAAIEKAKVNAEQNLKNAKELFESYLQRVFDKKDKGWEDTSLRDEINLLVGFAFKSKEYTEIEDDILLLRGDNIMQGSLRWKDVKRWKKSDYEYYKKYQLQQSDIVLAMDRPWVKAGLKIAKLSENDLPALLVQRTACLRTKSKLDNSFLFYLLKSSRFMSYLISAQTGIGVPHISGQQILNFKFYKPPLTIQQTTVQKLNILATETKKLDTLYRTKINVLEELKKSILKKAFSGELKTSNLELAV
jgi:type I restriction enzyme S subunit